MLGRETESKREREKERQRRSDSDGKDGDGATRDGMGGHGGAAVNIRGQRKTREFSCGGEPPFEASRTHWVSRN